jgi:hypothetical protein
MSDIRMKHKTWTHLQPERCSLANRGQLCGLEVREPQRGEITILFCENGEAIDHHGELFVDNGQGGSKEDKVCIAEFGFYERLEEWNGTVRTHSVT